jgi:hypothetical protein
MNTLLVYANIIEPTTNKNAFLQFLTFLIESKEYKISVTPNAANPSEYNFAEKVRNNGDKDIMNAPFRAVWLSVSSKRDLKIKTQERYQYT